ncbi:hypothetical protein M947_01915 [Sulfurimonas hongkongensis]|uniref:Uncharacterized protein n=1 Tax=Sulfurimonas hongkongensis TaxID=1172190 RepID=T0KUB9_9BACT|nr:hypothetical protein [Sulfurimonas hongkongensis]EQB40584.1 hypothetical protein M947_01915 [Sulfurimonas hongkongensis]
MNKIFLMVVLSTFLFSSEIPTRTGVFPQKEMKSQNITIAEMVAQETSKSLPQVIDKYTTFTSIKNDGATLVYTFEINTGSKSDEAVRKEDRSRMKEAVTMGVCQTSHKFLKAGINALYVYISAKSKAKLFEFNISQEDCPVILE